ncbi:uncharacterized protein MAL13P1.304-like [Achroia grisella]|uniref:uncharacterized protein MAL13P1.304-like n=1 Tax=Achroia grisella TaxID=688607 RepID=UPI0027D23595|nr:uncharacterized protein MAL13P1.304-like [Achroia grisella]
MGKGNSNKCKREDTLLLFKKSNTTLFTHSRTCSGVSQLYAKSAILQIKQNLFQAKEYYIHNDKLKRDLSLETDICILRRYYRSKRYKSSHKSLSVKSKYSAVDTEFGTIEEFEPDVSASGDNSKKASVVMMPNLTNINITSLMMRNLKVLLNNWIKSHLLEDKEMKQKFDNILNCILQKLEKKRTKRLSSCMTYVMDNDKNISNNKKCSAIANPYYKQKDTISIFSGSSQTEASIKKSYNTIPFPYKHVNIISTLSIPRNFTVRKTNFTKTNKSKCKIKKNSHNHQSIILKTSKNKMHKLFVTASSFNLLTASSKPNLQCGTFSKENNESKFNKKGQIVFFPKLVHKSDASDSTILTEVHKNSLNKYKIQDIGYLDVTPNLIRSIYAHNLMKITNNNYKNKHNNYTMTDAKLSYRVSQTKLNKCMSNIQFYETDITCTKRNVSTMKIPNKQRDPMTMDSIKQSVELPKTNIRRHNQIYKRTIKDCQHIKNNHLLKKKRRIYKRKKLLRKLYNISQYTNIKKSDNDLTKKKNLIGELDNIFKYFSKINNDKNIKLDIHINVFPVCENEPATDINTHDGDNANKISLNKISDIETMLYNTSLEKHNSSKENISISFERYANIIPILDGSMSQSKYIFPSNNSRTKSLYGIKNDCNFLDRSTTTNDLVTSREIIELKEVVKNLVATTEKLVIDHLKKQNSQKLPLTSDIMTNNKITNNIKHISSNEKTQSKEIKKSKSIRKSQLSGLKLSKEPKKTVEFTSRLAKRSTSYHIIDSESILKVTDMTSAIIDFKTGKENQILQCSLPKSKSLLDITSSIRKKPQQAFFCNRCYKKNEYIRNSRNDYEKEIPPTSRGNFFQNKSSQSGNSKHLNGHTSFLKPTQESNRAVVIPIDFEECNPYCSTKSSNAKKPKSSIRNWKSLKFRFCEAFLYCILLWIPMIVIGYFLYVYIIQNILKPSFTVPLKLNKTNRLIPIKNSSRLYLKVSDLGF